MIIHHGRKKSRAPPAQFFFSLVSILVFNLSWLPSVLAATDCTAVTEIPQAECQTLIALYNSTAGPNWTDKDTNNWNVTDTPCSWIGITCVSNNVTEIVREKENLSGSIPDLSALTQLSWLNLGDNQLSGNIPPNLSALTNLQYLYLDNNQLSGNIPDLSALTNLKYLYLDSNQLSGNISNLSALTNLQFLALNGNQLSGNISNLSALTQLQYLFLADNQFSGPIPNLSALTQLQELWLNGNQLSGTIPDLSALTQLQTLHLSFNQLSGTIPNLSVLTQLQKLDLSYNGLTGSIPDLSVLTQLDQLLLNDNQLCGEIPSSLVNLNLTELSLENNHLTASNPTLIAFLNSKDPAWINQTPCGGTSPPSTPLPSPTPPAQPLPPTMNLTLHFSGSGHGHVTTEPSGIDCDSSELKCSHSFETATWINLTPTAAEDSKFTGWSGNQSDCDNGELFMSGFRSCTAYFELLRFPLTITTVGQGQVSSDPVGIHCGDQCQSSFDINTNVTLTAIPEKGWQFQEWSGDCNNQGQVVMKENQACQATFFQLPSDLPPIDNTITTAKILHLVILTGPKQLTGEPQATLPMELELVNGGPEADIYNLTVSDSAGWNLTTLPAALSVAGLGHETLVLNVTLPAMIGEKDTITVTATSAAEPTVTSSTEIVVAVVGNQTQPATTAVEVNKQPITTESVTASHGEPVADSEVELPPVTENDSSTIPAVDPFSSLPPETPPCYASGLVDWVCNAQGQILTDLIVGPNGMIAYGTLVGTLTNQGRVSNLTLEPDSRLTGWIVTGYIINHGEMADFEFRGAAIVGGTLVGEVTNTSQVDGYFRDVQLAAGAHLRGGQLAGEISGDAQAPALLEDLAIQTGSHLQFVTMGDGVKLAANVTLGEGVQFNHPSDDPRLVPKQLPQPLACDTQLPLLGVTAINAAGQVIETQCQCAGGISVNGGSFEPMVKVRLADTVEIRGTVCIAPEQLGQLADLVVYLDYQPMNVAAEEKQHYMLDSDGEVLPWDGQVAHLVAFQQTMLTAVQEVLLYQGQLATTGKLNLFFGYRLMDGTIISNNHALEITITDQ